MTHIPSWLSSLPITFPYCASLPSHLVVPIRPQLATDYSNSAPAPLHIIKRVGDQWWPLEGIEILQDAVTGSAESVNSADSGLDSESFAEKMAAYVVIEARDTLQLTATEAAAEALSALTAAWADRACALPHTGSPHAHEQLLNDIGSSFFRNTGPGSTVHLVTRAETDLAGNDRVLAVADYDVDDSPPSTPGDVAADPSGAPTEDPWDRFEGGFAATGEVQTETGANSAPDTPLRSPTLSWPADRADTLYRKLTDQRLVVKLHDLEELTVPCPQRNWRRLYALRPTRAAVRYYVVVERISRYEDRRIVVRSPLQIRNETCYALEVSYKRSELTAAGAQAAPGDLTNPFDDKLRVATIAPQETYNVPLYIAYHCRLFLLPANFESYQTASQGIWWIDLSKELGTPRDVICPAKADGDLRIFAMRILAEEGCKANNIGVPIPNYLIRVLPPLAMYNRLPYAVEVVAPASDFRARVEAGERMHTYTLNLLQTHKLLLELNYLGLAWTGAFSLSPSLTDKCLVMNADQDTDARDNRLGVCVKVHRDESWDVFLYAPYWIINKTCLPMQIKGCRQDAVYEVCEEPLLWGGGARGWRPGGAGAVRVRLRVHHSEWSRAFTLTVGTPGLVVCTHRERSRIYRIFLQVSLSELCPQLTKIVTLSPYFLVYNDTKWYLRFMEENETADLWMDLAPAQCVPFWPLTSSLMLHCKYRDSPLVSQHFPITGNHTTVLRMDKGRLQTGYAGPKKLTSFSIVLVSDPPTVSSCPT
ncbi:Vacuolar protein sorting-associated protein 13A [Eumeta japonica]|uniref:Vacuolar protein sorting-associated protein 13A n=1 Tax=Eumeta variegata TaxID=151549 RepID=A0A4C1VM41_EUMVA|nr:Vacuolar protein sorting-associated protein 13A [Eumeta japonica]